MQAKLYTTNSSPEKTQLNLVYPVDSSALSLATDYQDKGTRNDQTTVLELIGNCFEERRWRVCLYYTWQYLVTLLDYVILKSNISN